MQRQILSKVAKQRHGVFGKIVADQVFGSSALLGYSTQLSDEGDSTSRIPKRLQLMMINGVATSGDYTIPSQPPRDHAGGGSRLPAGGQLLMDRDGTVSGQASQPGDTSEGTSEEEEAGTSFQHEDAQLFEAALQHIREVGWTIEAVRQGASDLGLSPSIAAKFERPQASLVSYFVERCNQELIKKLENNKKDLLGMRMSERIQTAIQWRLEMLIPYMSNWSQALAIQSSPGSLPSSLKQLSKLVDDIWYACGDSSADFSWYTKRTTLAGIYAATEAYMLTDYSPGYADTWEALGRRMQDVAELGKLQKKAIDAANGVFGSTLSMLEQAFGNIRRGR